MSLRENVKSARERMGLTQVQLAKRVGVSQATISEIESGKSSDIASSTLFQLADALAVDPRALLTEEPVESAQRPPFHEEEAILKLFRRLSAENQRLLKAIAQVMIDHSPKKKA